MSSLKISAFVFVLALPFSAPAFADATGIGIGTGVGQASSTINVGKTYNLSGGGVGASNCANAAGIGPVSFSAMTGTCKRQILANYYALRGDYELADQIMAGDPLVKQAMKEMAAASNEVSASTMSAPKSAAPKSREIFLGGARYVLTAGQAEKYDSCVPMKFGTSDSPAVIKEGC